MSLDFLKNIKVEDPALMKKSGGGGVRKEWNPTGKTIRVWKDGSIFPSEELVEYFDLEYRPKDVDHQGNGLDVFPTSQFPIFKSPQPLILINVVDKAKPRIDVFGTVGYYAEAEGVELPEGVKAGDPQLSVLDQGAATFGKNRLLPMIKETYDVEPNEKGFIDLVVLGADGTEATQPFALSKDFCHVPKAVTKGDLKGTATYQRREYPRLYALYPATLLETTSDAEAEGGKEPE